MKSGVKVIISLVVVILMGVAAISLVNRAKTTADSTADVADSAVTNFSDKLDEFSK